MDLPRKMISSHLGATAAALLFGSSCVLDCYPQSSAELETAAIADGCPEVFVHETAFESIDGLAAMERPKSVSVVNNPQLNDISGASGALSVDVAGNEQLREVDLTVRNQFSAGQHFEQLSLRFRPIETVFQSLTLDPAPDRLTLSCEGSCNIEVQLYSFERSTMDFDAAVQFFLDLSAPVADWRPLQGLGLPRAVRIFSPQDSAVIDEYLAWLQNEGFTGPFELCDDQLRCDDIAAR